MNDPTRWLERDAPAGALELLRAAAPTRAVPPEVKARSAERVAGLALSSAATTTVAGVSFGLGAKVVGLAAVALVVVGLAWRAKTTATVEVRPRTTRVLVAPPVVPVPTPREEVPPEPRPTPRVEVRRPSDPRPSPPPADDPLKREIDALARVSSVLNRDPRAARRRLDEYRRSHPRGQLAEERDFLAFEIARRLGERDEASERASAFLHDYPHSSHKADVRDWMRTQ